jgi:hypothetical protein
LDYGDLVRVKILLEDWEADFLRSNSLHLLLLGNWWHVQQGDKTITLGWNEPSSAIREAKKILEAENAE